jgi:nucleoside-diphosphate-sugar epimerase
MADPQRIVITGAGGFVGKRLVRALLHRGELGGRPIGAITCVDIALPPVADARVRGIAGDLLDAAVLAEAVRGGVDTVFHLATIPGGAAERNYDLSRRVNVDGAFAVLEAVRNAAAPPRVVFTSTIAVYGVPLPEFVDDSTMCTPTMTYGGQKLMIEAAISDFTRKGWIDGRAVRLSGIVARPRQANSGLISAYLSDVFTLLAEGLPFVCPVGPEATSWMLSVHGCIANLLHAGDIGPEGLPHWRAWNLPTQCLSMRALVDAIAAVTGADAAALVRYAPNPTVQAQFGSYPPIATAIADRLGFAHDGDPATLVRNALAAAAEG